MEHIGNEQHEEQVQPVEQVQSEITPPEATINMDEIDDVVSDETTESTWGKPANPEEPEEGSEEAGSEETPEFDERTGDLLEESEETPADDETEFYSGLGEVLKTKGFFGEDIEITSEDDLVTAFEKEVQARLDDTTKQVMEYMNNGIPVKEISGIQQAIQEANGISEQDVAGSPELAKNLIALEFKNKGFSEEETARFVDLIEKAGDLSKEGVKALENRRNNLSKMYESKIDEYKKLNAEKEQQERKRIEELVEKIQSPEVFGRKLSKTTRDKLQSTMDTVVGYTEDGQPVNAIMKYKLENPVDFEHKLLYLFTITDGFKSLDTFDRSAETRISRSFKDSVARLKSGKSFTDKQVTPKTKIDIDTIDDIV